jgi:hypothetical protein
MEVEMPPLEQADPQTEVEAEYTLEASVRCPGCKGSPETMQVVRLLRTKVNFTSTFSRRGYALICPECRTVLSAGIGSRVSL